MCAFAEGMQESSPRWNQPGVPGGGSRGRWAGGGDALLTRHTQGSSYTLQDACSLCGCLEPAGFSRA